MDEVRRRRWRELVIVRIDDDREEREGAISHGVGGTRTSRPIHVAVVNLLLSGRPLGPGEEQVAGHEAARFASVDERSLERAPFTDGRGHVGRSAFALHLIREHRCGLDVAEIRVEIVDEPRDRHVLTRIEEARVVLESTVVDAGQAEGEGVAGGSECDRKIVECNIALVRGQKRVRQRGIEQRARVTHEDDVDRRARVDDSAIEQRIGHGMMQM